MIKLRHNRFAWVTHCRDRHLAKAVFNDQDDGFCDGGIVPFGAVAHSLVIERLRLAAATSALVPARITGWDESGVGMALTCPYCRQEHKHIVVPDVWAPDELLMASCDKGAYRVRVAQDASCERAPGAAG